MFSKCIISNATITGFLFLEFLRNLKTKFVFCISHHGYHVGLETVFWMADVDEMAQVRGSWEKLPSCQSGKVSCFKETKRFPLVFLLLIKSYQKNGFEKKIICHPTHHDITSYQDIRVHIPVWQEKHSLLHSRFKEMMCFLSHETKWGCDPQEAQNFLGIYTCHKYCDNTKNADITKPLPKKQISAMNL